MGDSQPAQEVAALEKRAEPATRTRKLNPILVREMQERRDGLEEEIARCEAEITTYEMDLANFKSAEESIRLIKLIDQNRTRLEEMMKEWEQIGLTLEEPGKAVLGDR